MDRREQEANSPEEKQRIWAGLLTTPEGRILVAGLVMAILGIACLTLSWPVGAGEITGSRSNDRY